MEDRKVVKNRCKACFPCPMGVVGCPNDLKPHGHGSGQVCEECGVPYYKVHPHSSVCSRGTPITDDVVHSEYHMKNQLQWKKHKKEVEKKDDEK